MSDHESTKRKLKIIGGILVAVGGICALIGFIDFFLAMTSFDSPKLFFLLFIGLPCLGIGIGLLSFAFKREITRYVKNETMPVVNEAGEEIKPAVKAVTEAVAEGLKGKDGASPDTKQKICAACGSANEEKNRYCDKCGAPLFRVCPSCGSEQDLDDKFCGNCGAKLE